MKKLSALFFFIFFLFLTPRVYALEEILFPAADASVRGGGGGPDNNTGNLEIIAVGDDYSNNILVRGLIKFDLSRIPQNAIIDYAELKLYQEEVTLKYQNGGATLLGLFLITQDWNENTVTFDNQPTVNNEFLASARYEDRPMWGSFVVTKTVKSWINKTVPNYGFYIGTYHEHTWWSMFTSKDARESENQYRPQLFIRYSLPVTPTLIIRPPLIIITPGIIIPPYVPPIIIPLDMTAPVISNISASPGLFSAKISWTTNEKANSFVDYGTTAIYGKVAGQADSTTQHTVNLSGLKAFTTYHFRIRSKDNANNEARSQDKTFKTFIFIGGANPTATPTQIPNPEVITTTPTLTTPSTTPLTTDTIFPQQADTMDMPASNQETTAINTDNSPRVYLLPAFKKIFPNTGNSTTFIFLLIIVILIGVIIFLLRKNSIYKRKNENNVDNHPEKNNKKEKPPMENKFLSRKFLLILLVLLLVFLLFGVWKLIFIKEQNNPSTDLSPTVIPTISIIPDSSVTVELECDSAKLTLAKAFANKSYKILKPCLTDLTQFSRFESTENKHLLQEELIAEITNLSKNVQSWYVDQENPGIVSLKEAHSVFFTDADIVISVNTKDAFAFNFDKDGKIWTVVYMSDYPSLE